MADWAVWWGKSSEKPWQKKVADWESPDISSPFSSHHLAASPGGLVPPTLRPSGGIQPRQPGHQRLER